MRPLGGLLKLPIGVHGGCAPELRIAEDVGVPTQHLGANPGHHIREGEAAALLGHTGMEDNLQKQVPQLVAKLRHGVALDGLGDLVGLLQGIGQDAAKVLCQVPGAAALGVAQPGHDGQQVIDARLLGAQWAFWSGHVGLS